MTTATHIPNRPVRSVPGEPAWEVASLFPPQGQWTEADYLGLLVERGVELVDRRIEVLPMPKLSHQRIQMFLLECFLAFVRPRGLGEVLVSGTRIKCRDNTLREPDIVWMSSGRHPRETEDYWLGADLVIEIVSPDEQSRVRDWRDKKHDYARAGIGEYWIVDPQDKRIAVLRLDRGQYVTHCEAGETGALRSAVIDGLCVEAADIRASANRPQA